MNYNPYAAPQAGMSAAPVGAPGAGAPQPWEVGEVFQKAIDIFKVHWVPLVLAIFIPAVIEAIPSGISNGVQAAMRGSDSDGAAAAGALIGMVFSVIAYAVAIFFQVGQIRMFLTAARGGTPQIAQLFSGGNRVLPLFATAFLVGLAVFVGFLALIIGAFIAALGLMFSTYYCVDAELGPVESLKASWKATDGQKGKLFLLMLAFIGLMIAGLLACCVGIIPAQALGYLVLGIVFLRISGRGSADASAASGMVPPPGYGPPGGGYGAPPPGGGYGGPPPGGGYGGPPPGGGYGPQGGGGGYGPQGGGGGYGPQGGGGGYGPQGGGGGYGPQGGGGGYGPQGGGGGYGPQGGGGGYGPQGGGGGYGPQGGGGGYGPQGGGGGYGPQGGGGGY
jgi:uncharacterized membrane protein